VGGVAALRVDVGTAQMRHLLCFMAKVNRPTSAALIDVLSLVCATRSACTVALQGLVVVRVSAASRVLSSSWHHVTNLVSAEITGIDKCSRAASQVAA
jgi:hypothetical protein